MKLTMEDIERRRTAPVPTRDLADGRRLWLFTMMFTYRLCIGKPGADGYDNAWCFDSTPLAFLAFRTWNPLDPATPEPEGWIKNPVTGETRPTNGGSDDDHDAADQ